MKKLNHSQLILPELQKQEHHDNTVDMEQKLLKDQIIVSISSTKSRQNNRKSIS